ncbi:MAG: ABC transporter ATP-binding protein, partial [Acidimicrobiales bacterium]
ARLAEAGTTMVLVEQFVTHALRHADICYVLAKGRVTFVGEPAEVADEAVLSGYLGGGAAAASTGSS